MPKNQNSSVNLPKNWPPGLPYLTTPTYSPTLTPPQLSALRTRPASPTAIPSQTPFGPSPLVRITPIATPTHPANGQSGLFAAKNLAPGSFILVYLGAIHPTLPVHAASDYDLSLDRENDLAIDAAGAGNEARFVNDYRGVEGRPNAEFRECWDARRGERGMGVWVLPRGKSGKGVGIRKGEEILISYGRGFWGARKSGEEDGGEEGVS